MKKKKDIKVKPEETLVHIKFDYFEALNSKKDVLEVQTSFLKIMKAIVNYRALREKEVKFKLKLYYRVKKLNKLLDELEKKNPEIKIPGIRKAKHEIIHHEGIINQPKENKGIESQLLDIQGQIKMLESKMR